MKNVKTWERIMEVYPDAVVDFEYSNGETLFYASQKAAEDMDDNFLYTCLPDGRILTDF